MRGLKGEAHSVKRKCPRSSFILLMFFDSSFLCELKIGTKHALERGLIDQKRMQYNALTWNIWADQIPPVGFPKSKKDSRLADGAHYGEQVSH